MQTTGTSSNPMLYNKVLEGISNPKIRKDVGDILAEAEKQLPDGERLAIIGTQLVPVKVNPETDKITEMVAAGPQIDVFQPSEDSQKIVKLKDKPAPREVHIDLNSHPEIIKEKAQEVINNRKNLNYLG